MYIERHRTHGRKNLTKKRKALERFALRTVEIFESGAVKHAFLWCPSELCWCRAWSVIFVFKAQLGFHRAQSWMSNAGECRYINAIGNLSLMRTSVMLFINSFFMKLCW